MRCLRRRLCQCLSLTNNHTGGVELSLIFYQEVIALTDKKGVYIHIPFCRRKCKYCDFTSYADKYDLAEKYFERIVAEIKTHNKYKVDTVYIGGGTPSSVDGGLVAGVLDAVYSHFSVEKDAEITIEVNPDSVGAEKLSIYKKAGINRISMGAQSFDDGELKMLGRLHNKDDIADKYNLIRKSGFDNVSLDLMFGLPGQTESKLCKSIDSMLNLSPEHISCYGLKIENGTPFYMDYASGRLALPDDDYFADLYEYMCKRLTEAGYVQYEISNFCLPDKFSRHNSKYWQCDEYVGIGAGAASYLDGVRSRNTDELLSYVNETEEVLAPEDKMAEFVIFGLRMTNSGINTDEFYDRFGKDIFEVFGKQLEKHKRFISQKDKVLKLTKEAYYVSNAIFSDFID